MPRSPSPRYRRDRYREDFRPRERSRDNGYARRRRFSPSPSRSRSPSPRGRAGSSVYSADRGGSRSPACSHRGRDRDGADDRDGKDGRDGKEDGGEREKSLTPEEGQITSTSPAPERRGHGRGYADVHADRWRGDSAVAGRWERGERDRRDRGWGDRDRDRDRERERERDRERDSDRGFRPGDGDRYRRDYGRDSRDFRDHDRDRDRGGRDDRFRRRGDGRDMWPPRRERERERDSGWRDRPFTRSVTRSPDRSVDSSRPSPVKRERSPAAVNESDRPRPRSRSREPSFASTTTRTDGAREQTQTEPTPHAPFPLAAAPARPPAPAIASRVFRPPPSAPRSERFPLPPLAPRRAGPPAPALPPTLAPATPARPPPASEPTPAHRLSWAERMRASPTGPSNANAVDSPMANPYDRRPSLVAAPVPAPAFIPSSTPANLALPAGSSPMDPGRSPASLPADDDVKPDLSVLENPVADVKQEAPAPAVEVKEEAKPEPPRDARAEADAALEARMAEERARVERAETARVLAECPALRVGFTGAWEAELATHHARALATHQAQLRVRSAARVARSVLADAEQEWAAARDRRAGVEAHLGAGVGGLGGLIGV